MRSHAQAVSGQKVMTPQMQSIHWEEGSFSAGVILCGGHSLWGSFSAGGGLFSAEHSVHQQ